MKTFNKSYILEEAFMHLRLTSIIMNVNCIYTGIYDSCERKCLKMVTNLTCNKCKVTNKLWLHYTQIVTIQRQNLFKKQMASSSWKSAHLNRTFMTNDESIQMRSSTEIFIQKKNVQKSCFGCSWTFKSENSCTNLFPLAENYVKSL